MDTITTVLRYEIWILLTGLAAVVTYQLLTNKIRTDGLLRDKTPRRAFSPSRVQMLVLTIAAAVYFLMTMLSHEKPSELPEIPTELIMALGGSHVFYLGGKLYSLFTYGSGLSSPGNK